MRKKNLLKSLLVPIMMMTTLQLHAVLTVSIAEFNEASENDSTYCLTGIITKVVNTTYGNFYLRDYSGETYIYGIGVKGDFMNWGLKEVHPTNA